MILWLDDIRPPWKHGYVGAEWCKTADAAIALLQTGKVTFASLDHDLSELATVGILAEGEKTGYTVICWMEENNVWPEDGCRVHSMNPVGKARMLDVIRRAYEGRSVNA
jgi:hypothetical protein